MPVVQILLSTFNGERYLPALLDSLLAQAHADVSILARDDGSTDGTTAVLQRYADSGVRWYGGQHLGIRRSFLDLLARADDRAAAFAFCDQDDVWMPDKLARAWARLDAEGGGQPTLYCARARLVDQALRPMGLTRPAHHGPSLRNALVENIAPGCTMVLNPQARALLLKGHPRGAGLHDAWVYLVISALGRVVYDDVPSVLYRQHAANAIGVQHRRWHRRLRRLFTPQRNRDLHKRFVGLAAELERIYGADLDPANREIVGRFVRGRDGALGALKYALGANVYRQTTLDTIILKTLLALRRI